MDVPPTRYRWPIAAMLGGAAAAAVTSFVLAAGYYLRFTDMGAGWSWSLWAVSVAVLGPLSGAAWGLFTCGGVVAADRLAARGWSKRVANPVVGGAVGGILGGIAPSLIGVMGYGSLHAPYAGTGIIATAVLLGIVLFSTFGSLPAAVAESRLIPTGRAVSASLLASILLVVPFGMVVATTVTTLLPEPVVRQIVNWIGNSPMDSSPCVLATFGMGLAVTTGILLGGFAGMTTVLARLLRRTVFATIRR